MSLLTLSTKRVLEELPRVGAPALRVPQCCQRAHSFMCVGLLAECTRSGGSIEGAAQNRPQLGQGAFNCPHYCIPSAAMWRTLQITSVVFNRKFCSGWILLAETAAIGCDKTWIALRPDWKLRGALCALHNSAIKFKGHTKRYKISSDCDLMQLVQVPVQLAQLHEVHRIIICPCCQLSGFNWCGC